MKLLPLAIFVVIPVLHSCVSYRAKPVSAEASQADFAHRSLQDPGLESFLKEHQAEGATWDMERLALAAVYFHPDVALARAEAGEAQAAIQTAGQRPNPSLTLGTQFASNLVGVTPWFAAKSIAIPIETAGKRGHRLDQAVALANAAKLRLASRAWAARSRVRLAMLELHGARQNLRLLEKEQALHDEAIRRLTAQMQAGDVSPFELTQARLSLNRTRLGLQDARRLEATGEAKVAAAVGVSLQAIHTSPLNFKRFESLPPISTAKAHHHALTRRPDLMALLADYAAAEAALHLEIARQYPDLRLNPGYDFNQGQNRWQMGLNLELPLNRNRGPIAQAAAKRKTVEARFLAQQRAIQGELDVALAAYRSSKTKVEVASTLAREALSAASTTQRAVEAGDLSPLENTRRQLELSSANVALLAASLEAQAAAGLLEDAMQSPLR